MRGFGQLIIILIGVAVVYGVYWSMRAVAVAKDAAHVVKKTGSISEAVSFIWQNQRMPDGLRLSAAQQDYVTRNEAIFFAECGDRMRKLTHLLLEQRIAELGLPEDINDPRVAGELKTQMAIAGLRIAKAWCEERGIR